jgi:membrane fusion protein (multidrug efflux system)
MRFKSNILFCLMVMMIIIGSCSKGAASKGDKKGGGMLVVEALIVKPQPFESQIAATANLLPSEETELKAPLSGTVMNIYFKEGEFVKKGTLLVQIDDRVLNARLKGLEAQLTKTKSELSRKKELLAIEGTSQEDVDQAMATVSSIEAQMEELRVNIGLSAIKAPFDGKVGLRDFSLGAYLSQGQRITTIVQSQSLKVDFNLAGRYLQYLGVNDKVKLIYGGDTLVATIYAIDASAAMSSRTVRFRARVANEKSKLVPGDFAKIIVPITSNLEALTVPTNVIIPEIEVQTVYVYKNGKAMRREVELGVRTDRFVEITNGLAIGDTVISTGLMEIKNQLPVQLKTITNLP